MQKESFLKGLKIACTGFSKYQQKEREELVARVKAAGAEYIAGLSSDTTHLIVIKVGSEKYTTARTLPTFIVEVL